MRSLLLLATILLALGGWSQGRFDQLAIELEAATAEHPGLTETVDMSVSNTPVTEFVRALGVTHKMNLSIDPSVTGEVVNNFSDARVADVILFLCKQYDLELEQIGSILALKPYRAPPEPSPPPTAKQVPSITWSY